MLLLWVKVDLFIPIILPNLNLICHLLTLGAHYILHVGRIRVKHKRISLLLISHTLCYYLQIPPNIAANKYTQWQNIKY
jgi:hypothetical protein